VGPKEPSGSKDPTTKPGGDGGASSEDDGNSPTKPPGTASASSGAVPPKLPFSLSLLDEEPTLKEPRLGDSDVNPQDNNEQGGEGDADGVSDGGMAAILDPIGQGAMGNSASGADPDKVYSVAPETLALLRLTSSLISPNNLLLFSRWVTTSACSEHVPSVSSSLSSSSLYDKDGGPQEHGLRASRGSSGNVGLGFIREHRVLQGGKTCRPEQRYRAVEGGGTLKAEPVAYNFM
jgi:hypothetical protein